MQAASPQPSSPLPAATRPLSGFEQRWLCEALATQVRGEDAPAHWRRWLAALPETPADPEQALLQAASKAPDAAPLQPQIHSVQRALSLTALGLLIMAALLGSFSALGALGEGARGVNILWLCGALLGSHVLALVLWFVLILRRPGEGSFLGDAAQTLSQRLLLRFRPELRAVSSAYQGLATRSDLLRWQSSSLSHAAWMTALLAAALALVLALSLRSYHFVWETTLLSEENMLRLVHLAGWLPAWIGFPLPEDSLILASTLGSDGSHLPPQTLADRRSWSLWILGCLFVYGILPRALLLLFCRWRSQRIRQRLRLDLGHPYWARLLPALQPSTRNDIVDPDPGATQGPLFRQHQSAGGAALIVPFELSPEQPWPLPGHEELRLSLGTVMTRADREQALQQLATQQPQRLLILCDRRQTPDRSSRRWLSEASAWAGSTAVLLLGEGSPHTWQRSLADMGLPAPHCFDQPDRALTWLNTTMTESGR